MIPGNCPKLQPLSLLILMLGCTAPQPPEPAPVPPPEATLTFSEDRLKATVTFPEGAALNEVVLNPLLQPKPGQFIEPWLSEIEDDSIRKLVKNLILESVPKSTFRYSLTGINHHNGEHTLEYKVDPSLIEHIVRPLVETYGTPENKLLNPLFAQETNPPGSEAFTSLSLILPCENTPVPQKATLLPNAPREYRNGIHRGIDFFADWGTPVRAAASGTVIRADHGFTEVEPDFREKLLEIAHKTGHTPSDIFNHILLGRAVFIDHGFDLVPGYRAFSIYAHLADIDKSIALGSFIDRGQVIGLSGNSGIKDATLGKRTGAHLHWELILQNKDGEYYLGQGFNYDELFKTIQRVFVGK